MTKFRIDKPVATPGDDELLTTEQVAEWFNVSKIWVEIGRHKGYGPPFVRVSGNCIRYRRGEVRDWLGQRSHTCTREYVDAS